MSLYDELIEYSKNGRLPMHMPGHKRRIIDDVLPYSIDITEIEGFDNLHDRRGILASLAERLAKSKGAACAFPVVGGSTAPVLASVHAMTKPGDTVIMARNCHKSVYRACEIRNLKTKYLYPAVSPEGFFLSAEPRKLDAMLRANPGTSLIIITSPTYEGIISDISSLARIAHSHGAKLFVDAAHGAHLGYADCFPRDAVSLGADAAAESLHKTLPALTQTSALYLGEGTDPRPFEDALDIYETSSPSYVLLASIDRCLAYIENREVFYEYSRRLDGFYSAFASDDKNSPLRVIDYSDYPGVSGFDRGKIIVSTLNFAGSLSDILRNEYRIEPEMEGAAHLVLMTSVCDTDENFKLLAGALGEINSRAQYAAESRAPLPLPKAKTVMTLGAAARLPSVFCPAASARGCVCAGYLWAYPPGIPLLAPGEIITPGIISFYKKCARGGIRLSGTASGEGGMIKVLA